MSEWISVKERLPEEDGLYLVTVNNRGYNRVEKCDFESGNEERPFCPLEHHDFSRGYHKRGYPKELTIAWMPLPEPYKEDNE